MEMSFKTINYYLGGLFEALFYESNETLNLLDNIEIDLVFFIY